MSNNPMMEPCAICVTVHEESLECCPTIKRFEALVENDEVARVIEKCGKQFASATWSARLTLLSMAAKQKTNQYCYHCEALHGNSSCSGMGAFECKAVLVQAAFYGPAVCERFAEANAILSTMNPFIRIRIPDELKKQRTSSSISDNGDEDGPVGDDEAVAVTPQR